MKRASILAVVCALGADVTSAQSSDRRLSAADKCEIYKSAWDSVTASARDLSTSFVESNVAFIKGDCVNYGDVCPRTEGDLAAANMLTVLTMNHGLASTFVPFKCAKPK